MTKLSQIPLRDRIFFATVYFVQGAMGIAALAKLYFLKNEVALNEVQFATITALAILPFTIKPLYGLISDFFPIFGRRRKFYLCIGSVINSVSWILLSSSASEFWAVFWALTMTNVGLAIVDVIADGMVVERSTRETVGKLQTLCWTSLSIAALIASVSGGVLVEIFEPRTIFLFTAALPFLTFFQAIFINDPKVDAQKGRHEVRLLEVFLSILAINFFGTILIYLGVENLWPLNSFAENFANSILTAFVFGNLATIFLINKFVQRFDIKPFLMAVTFLFLWRSTPSAGAQFQYFILEELKWDAMFLGYLSFTSTAGNIVGAVLFWKFFDKINLRKLFFWTILIGSLAGLLNIIFVIQPEILAVKMWEFTGLMFFALIAEFLLGMIFYLGFLPLFKLAAKIVPRGIEATMFALVASFMNLGLLISTHGGGQLGKAMGVVDGNYENLSKFLIVTSIINLGLLAFVFLVPKNQDEEISEENPTL